MANKFSLRVGASRKCITPREDMFPFSQSELNGTGLYTYVRKDVYLRAVALDNGAQKLLFLVSETNCGNLHHVKEYAAKTYGLSADAIFYSDVHNHSCALSGRYDPDTTFEEASAVVENGEFGPKPSVRRNEWEYGKLCYEQAIAAIDEAFATMQPAKFGYGKGNSYINVSRDEQLHNGRYIFGTNHERPSDKTLAVMKFVDMDGKMIAAILNYAVHSTMGFRVRNAEGHLGVSGDLAGEIASFVEEAYKDEDPVVAWTIAAAGNQTPIHSFFHEYFPDGTYDPDERFDKVLDPFMYKLCSHMAQRQGADAVAILSSINTYKENIRLDIAERFLKLPATRVEGWGKPQLLDDRVIEDDKLYNVDVPDKFVYIGLKLVKIGDMCVLGYEGEMMCEIGLRLKEKSPLREMVIITCYVPAADRDLSDKYRGSRYYVDKWGFENKTPSYGRNPVKDAMTEEKVTEAMAEMFDELLNK